MLVRPHGAERGLRRLRDQDHRGQRHGDEYVINGSKMFITNAGHADWLVVFASTDKSKGHKGLSAFVVPTDLDGVVVEKHLDKMGQRATDTSAIAFGDVKVPVENRLGEEGEGFKIAMTTLDFTRRARPPAPSGSHRQRSTTRSSTQRRGCSSGSRSR